ncbi:membrane-bound lytic murein transglycosylase MltF [Paraneptunicella aestuarii]|nr:membrane-bound lytic murein transglycosylase MltF [Paraneptunicella aestuarii]
MNFSLILCCLFLLQSCDLLQQHNSLTRVLDEGVLKVGTRYGSTTYYVGATGEEGFEYELAQGFADYLGVRLEVFPYYNLNDMFPQLRQNHLDLIAAGITATPQRSQDFKFGPAYQDVSQKLVFKQGRTRPRNPSELDGSFTVTSGSSHAESLHQLKNTESEWRNISWRETDDEDEEELLQMVLDEKLDFTVSDSNTLNIMRRLYPELSVGFTIHDTQSIAWALNKNQDDALLAALIEYFGMVRENGKLAVLEDKYFGHVRQFNYVDTTSFLAAAKETLPKYQDWFEKYSADLDWRLIAAMSYQESHWNPRAKSPTGVRGMMMLTLPTAKELGVTSRLDPEQSIRGGTQYFRKLLRRIPERIQSPDRLWFALAAYNIGLGHLEDTRVLTEKSGGNPDLWIDVKQHLPLLRQKRFYKTTRYGYARGDEAIRYVTNIRRYYDSLVYLSDKNSTDSGN